MASEKILAMIEEVKALSVLELNELVKALEEEFGVSAAAVAAALRRRHFDRGLYPLPAQGQDVQADRPAAVRISEKGEKGRAAGHAPPTLFPRRLKSRRPTVTNTPCATPNSSPGSNT